MGRNATYESAIDPGSPGGAEYFSLRDHRFSRRCPPQVVVSRHAKLRRSDIVRFYVAPLGLLLEIRRNSWG